MPAFGSPTSPTSAIRRSSRRTQRSSPGSPFWACLGAWWVAVLKCVLPSPPRPPRRDHHLLSGGDQVGEELVGGFVEDRGAGRNAHHEVMARRTVAPRPLAPTAGRRLEVMAVLEVAQGRLAGVHREVHRTASTAIPAVGSAARDVRLAPEGRRAVAAVTGAGVDLDAVEEHRGHCPTAPAAGRDAGRRNEG